MINTGCVSIRAEAHTVHCHRLWSLSIILLHNSEQEGSQFRFQAAFPFSGFWASKLGLRVTVGEHLAEDNMLAVEAIHAVQCDEEVRRVLVLAFVRHRQLHPASSVVRKREALVFEGASPYTLASFSCSSHIIIDSECISSMPQRFVTEYVQSQGSLYQFPAQNLLPARKRCVSYSLSWAKAGK